MRFEDGALLRDQNGDSLGQYGDSCFDTYAFGLSHFWTSPGQEYHPQINHIHFFDAQGRSVRHRLALWQHDDMSEDNEKPLFIFLREDGKTTSPLGIASRVLAGAIIDNLKGWRTGNGKLITPGYYAEIKDWQWLRCLSQLIQAIFFLLPYWDDGARRIRFTGKTDGYLQWALIAYLTPRPFRRLISKQTLKNKISAYYKPELDAIGEKATTLLVIETHHRLVNLL